MTKKMSWQKSVEISLTSRAKIHSCWLSCLPHVWPPHIDDVMSIRLKHWPPQSEDVMSNRLKQWPPQTDDVMSIRWKHWPPQIDDVMSNRLKNWPPQTHVMSTRLKHWPPHTDDVMSIKLKNWPPHIEPIHYTQVPLIHFWPSYLKTESTNKIKDLAQKKLTITFSKRWCPINHETTVSCKLSWKYSSSKANRIQTIYSTPFFKTCVCDVTHALAGYGTVMCCMAWNWAHF